MGVLNRMWDASIAGWNAGMYAARRVFEDPATAHQQETFVQQASEYQLLWAYYNNSMFDRTARFMNSWAGSWQNNRLNPAQNGWSQYKSNYNLYRNIRLVYNPVRRLVDFYAGQVYPGLLSEDGAQLPDGVPLAIPFSEDTDPALKDAIAQFWQWSNWQAKKSVLVRYGASLGSVLVEVIDDVQRGKVVADVVWPGFVRDLQLDSAGNVKFYSLQYQVWNPDDGSYIYRKDVDQNAISYYKDDEPHDYGYGSVVENIYGFVPATWIKHMDLGADHGSPAIAGSFGKIDELNSLASHVHDQVHKVIGAPLVMWSDGAINSLFNNKARQSTNEFERPATEQENILLLKGPAGGNVSSLAGNLNLGETKAYGDGLLMEIEKDHPELVFYDQLRSMSQVTGPAASRLVGDVASRVVEVQANYDAASMSIFRMAVAMAGFRAQSGAWGALNRQQAKFTPFNLDSFARGDLDMAIIPRPLLVPTKLEMAQENQMMWSGVQAAVTAGAPLEIVLKNEGWTPEQIAELHAAKDREAKMQEASIQRQQFLSQQDTIPAIGQ
jgi:hypothetical protein